MLSLLYGCGLRRSEVVALDLSDYDQGTVTVRTGKGRKERIVYCPTGGRVAVEAWIARRGTWPGALLNPVAKGGHIQARAHDRAGGNAALAVSRGPRPRLPAMDR